MDQPLLVDLHIHGIESTDTTSDDIDDILAIARYQRSQGVGKIVLSIYSNDIDIMRKQALTVKKAMEHIRNEAIVDCVEILGVHLEGPFLNPERTGALYGPSFHSPSIPTLEMLLEGIDDIARIITIAPELKGAPELITHCRDRGIKVNMGHSDATFQEAMRGKNAGATGITHLFNAMRPFHHREPGITGFGLMDKDIYVEIIADGVHIDLTALNLVFTLKPHDRIIIISDSVKGPRGEDAVVYSDDGTIAGGGKTVSDGVKFLKQSGFDHDVVIATATTNPLRYLE